jgi:spore coat polysaccharide biosynthesis protein SpsF
MTKVLCIVQARMGSTRLPGKSLTDLGGMTLLECVYTGATTARSISDVIFAIPEGKNDDPLFEFLNERGMPVFRGPEEDLISRHLGAASKVCADFIVRIPGDNPVPHGSEIDRIVNFHLDSNPNGFSTNLSEVFGSGYPDGIGAEIFSFQCLEEVLKLKPTKAQREHPHLSFFDYVDQAEVHPYIFPVGTVKCPEQFARPDIILDINTKKDFEYFKSMFRDLGTLKPHIEDIIPWHDEVGYLLR